jgi:hypothetical protein
MMRRIVLWSSIASVLAFTVTATAVSDTRDGSTKARAILLKQRDPQRAVDEEFAWMTRLYHYTPLLAMRDTIINVGLKLKPGQKASNISPWGHSSQDYKGHLVSHWSLTTPHGQKDIYFDTGTLVDTPGEIQRQESARADYMTRMASTIKFPTIQRKTSN